MALFLIVKTKKKAFHIHINKKQNIFLFFIQKLIKTKKKKKRKTQRDVCLWSECGGNWFFYVLSDSGLYLMAGKQTHNSNPTYSPILIELPERPIFVTCGQAHAIALTNQNAFWLGKTGKEEPLQKIAGLSGTPILASCSDSDGYILTTEGWFYVSSPHAIAEMDTSLDHSTIQLFASGGRHTIISTQNGLYVIGVNPADFGSEFVGETKKNIFEPTKSLEKKKIHLKQFDDHEILGLSCGKAHSVIWTNKGLYGFGDNSYGPLGHSSPLEKKLPKGLHSLPFFYEKILGISTGWWFSNIITESGIYAFGYAGGGARLGLGDEITENQHIPHFMPLPHFLNMSDILFTDVVMFPGRPDILFLLLCARKFSPLSVFYHENLPLDLFKVITQQHARLGHFIPRKKE